MATLDPLFSSERTDWETPPDLFTELDREFRFGWDTCAEAHNTKCDHFWSPEDDGLAQPWPPWVTCWMNPPYGRVIAQWIEKAASEARQGVTVVCLIPARTDTRWWHDHIWDKERHQPRDGVQVRFRQGRIKFIGADAGAPFPSAIVVFGHQQEVFNDRSSSSTDNGCRLRADNRLPDSSQDESGRSPAPTGLQWQ